MYNVGGLTIAIVAAGQAALNAAEHRLYQLDLVREHSIHSMNIKINLLLRMYLFLRTQRPKLRLHR